MEERKNSTFSNRTLNQIYWFLISFRFLFIFTYGYIHPDEFFQNPSVVSNEIFDSFNSTVPWEFGEKHPVRTISIPFLISGIPFYLMKILSQLLPSMINITPRMLLFSPRIFLFLISLIPDHLMGLMGENYYQTKVLYATFWSVVLFHTRTFSNTIESFLLVVAFYCYFSKSKYKYYVFGIIFGVGFANRITFLFFIFPMIIFSMTNFTNIFKIGSTFSLITISVFIIDNLYFKRDHWVCVVWNFFAYSSDVENLATHTLHTRYLHSAVNFPLLFGPVGLYCYCNIFNHLRHDESAISNIFLTSILSGLSFLSLIPHQEPRFIIPLACPIVLLVMQNKPKNFNFLLVFSIAFGAFFSIFYGVIHQGGVLNAVLDHNQPGSKILFYHTYMPPNYLAHDCESIIDLQGAPESHLHEYINEFSKSADNLFIVYPKSIKLNLNATQIQLYCPHFSAEDFPNSIDELCLIKAKLNK